MNTKYSSTKLLLIAALIFLFLPQAQAKKVKITSFYGIDLVDSPAISVKGFGTFYSLRLKGAYYRADWKLYYSTGKELGLKVRAKGPNLDVGAIRTTQPVAGGLKMIKLYEVPISSELLEQAVSAPVKLELQGESATVSFTIEPKVAKAFMEKARPIELKWREPSRELTEELVKGANELITEERDDYKREAIIKSGKYSTANQELKYQLYSRKADNESDVIFLRVDSNRSHSRGWAFYDEAVDSNGSEMIVSTDSDVKRGGGTYEGIHIILTPEYLKSHVKTGLDFKIYGKRTSSTLQVPGWVLESFIRATNI